MHQARMIAALFQHLGDDRFLADVALADMLDRDPGFSGQRCPQMCLVLDHKGGAEIVFGTADMRYWPCFTSAESDPMIWVPFSISTT
jgi:hypothetical protein